MANNRIVRDDQVQMVWGCEACREVAAVQPGQSVPECPVCGGQLEYLLTYLVEDDDAECIVDLDAMTNQKISS